MKNMKVIWAKCGRKTFHCHLMLYIVIILICCLVLHCYIKIHVRGFFGGCWRPLVRIIGLQIGGRR